MDLGDILLKLAVVAAIASGALALNGLRGRKVPDAAVWAFGLHTLALVVALLLLSVHFLAHHFEYVYVAQYSSRALSEPLTLAAVWAGQEGSILLWTALSAVLGMALLRQPGPLPRPALVFVSLAQLFFMWLLMVKSPFVRQAPIPPDGMGLNPLLEDPWMVIHPPVLFVGYAAMLMPWALAAAALFLREYREFNRMVWPWAIFGVVVLGLGIGLGGVWAYKTLGWGGYWGWDPVENASLIPWLLAVALLHGLLIHRTTGALTRTNLLLAVLGWASTIGGTYLTRSGVLADFSVHSFADSGLNTPLLAFLGTFTIGGLALLVWRWRGIEVGRAQWLSVSREAALWLGLMTVTALAALVTLGTTAPLITSLSGRPSNVSTDYYRMVSVPVGLGIVLLMAIAPAFRWSRQQGFSWLAALVPGVIAAVALPVLASLAGVRDPWMLLLTLVSGLALGVNAGVATRLFQRGWSYGAGYLSHVGIGIMVLGMVISGTLGRSERLRLVEGQPTQALGYDLVLTGVERDARGSQIMAIDVARDGYRFDARPMLVNAPRMEGPMRKPAIDGWRDLYLSPLELESAAGGGHTVVLQVGQPADLHGTQVVFKGFRMDSEGGMEIRAELEATRDGRTTSLAPGMRALGEGRIEPLPDELPGVGPISITRINADQGLVEVSLPGEGAGGHAAVVELSTKPFVNLVWIGALVALLGSALAGIRRAVDRLPGRSRPAAQGA